MFSVLQPNIFLMSAHQWLFCSGWLLLFRAAAPRAGWPPRAESGFSAFAPNRGSLIARGGHPALGAAEPSLAYRSLRAALAEPEKV